MVADDASLTDDDAGAVVDSKILTDGGARMYVNAGLGVGLFGDNARDDGHAELMELMCDAVVDHGVDDGIAEDYLTVVWGSRIVVEHGLYVGVEQSLDLRKGVDELGSHTLGFHVDFLLGEHAVAVFTKLQSVGYLAGKHLQQLFHVNSDVVGSDGLVGLSLIEIVGEEYVLYKCHNLLYLFYGWQRSFCLWHHAYLLLAEF